MFSSCWKTNTKPIQYCKVKKNEKRKKERKKPASINVKEYTAYVFF